MSLVSYIIAFELVAVNSPCHDENNRQQLFIHCNEVLYFGKKINKSECQITKYTFFQQTNCISS